MLVLTVPSHKNKAKSFKCANIPQRIASLPPKKTTTANLNISFSLSDTNTYSIDQLEINDQHCYSIQYCRQDEEIICIQNY